jgi:2-amino-4-hydroxy-6-hydroxymethyldihydropteridine diphosphokinase
MKHTIYLGLGSNLGDRMGNLRAAVGALEPAVKPLALSPVYETAPWGYEEQDDFLNQVIRGETDLSPDELLKYVKAIERQLGRRPRFRYGPREIDVDILFFDDLHMESYGLNVPHPRIAERAFVLVPLADLAPDLHHPTLEKTVQELLAEVDTTGIRPHVEEDA